MKELTKAEEQLMQILWGLEKAYLKDIVEQYPDPAPAYTTISTVVNVLVKKGFIGFETHGKSREYSPLISKEKYTRQSMNGLMSSFFDNSAKQFASFFASQKDLSMEELQEIRKLIDEQIKQREA
ncbi:Predicted transcriptional regulator [Ekhidna lutea]|uniref:Predicted transcriptional regulator n=1 Tax=Ekhidna lutea TaxID=447679 RepID=A0A239JDV8_EKHLU|nr:BlaI/MecI/CopY family transcriptional regulator [Ekhidna lutea]SNT04017.1 Predicted transcriptional regulator [Ekhidna lutea]